MYVLSTRVLTYFYNSLLVINLIFDILERFCINSLRSWMETASDWLAKDEKTKA